MKISWTANSFAMIIAIALSIPTTSYGAVVEEHKELIGEGGIVCTKDEQCTTGYCNGGTCRYKCTHDSSKSKADKYGDCKSAGEDYYCKNAGTDFCKPQAPYEGFCSKNYQCTTGNCYWATCLN